jgi:hypothetical protein
MIMYKYRYIHTYKYVSLVGIIIKGDYNTYIYIYTYVHTDVATAKRLVVTYFKVEISSEIHENNAITVE